MENMESYFDKRKGVNYLSRHLRTKIKMILIIVGTLSFAVGFILGSIIF